MTLSLSWFVALPILFVLGFGLLVLPHNLRIRRCRRDRLRLPPEISVKVFDLLARQAGASPAITLMTRETSAGTDLLLTSHLGGEPYAEAGERWPASYCRTDGTDDPEAPPAPFVGQFVLCHPAFPPVWQGRLLTVFLQHDSEQSVRSHSGPSPGRYVRLAGGPAASPALSLNPLAIPELDRAGGEHEEPVDPVDPPALLRTVPAVREVLAPWTDDAEGLLAQLLSMGPGGYSLEGSDVIYQGGEPCLIQNPHEAVCAECSQPMRFLLQLGDVVPGIVLGDAGVLYVYGCDRHPERCAGFVDSH